MEAFLVSLTVVFLAELGDKSQLMALVFATRFAATSVLAGIAIASLAMHGLSVAVGAAVGAAIPERVVTVLAAVAFVGFGIWTLRDRDDPIQDPGQDPATDPTGSAAAAGSPVSAGSAVVAVATAVLLAELGDKTMLASAALATSQAAVPTWLGGTAGMVAADGLAIVVGRQLGDRIPQRVLRVGAAIMFFAFAVLLLLGG